MSTRSFLPRLSGPWRWIGAAGAGLMAGAALAHTLDTRGRFGPRRAAEPAPAHPEDFAIAEPGRGRAAEAPHEIPRKGWIDILWRAGASYFGDRLGFLAGGVTFFTVLSLFPTLAAFVALYGLFADPTTAWGHMYFLQDILPDAVANFFGEEMRRLAGDRKPALGLTLAGTVLAALWTANAAVRALFYGLNIVYHETEKRNVVAYNLVCMVFTVGGIGFLLVATGLVVAAPLVLTPLGLLEEVSRLTPLRWLALLAVYVVALTLVYRYGPCRARAKWRWLTPGGLVAALLSLVFSGAFSLYLSEIADFSRTYGSLGAMMGFLLWTWLSAQAILIGGALNAAIEHQTAVDSTTGAPRPLGERGATVADTVGPRRGARNALNFTLKHAEAVASRATRRSGRRPEPEPRKPPGDDTPS